VYRPDGTLLNKKMIGSQDRLLDAAERIVLRDGALHLTLEAVAAESGMSKGGLLYHFRSKEELVQGMVERLHTQYEAEVTRMMESDPNPRGRRTRAMLRASFPPRKQEKRARMEQLSAALLAAVVTNPNLLDETRKRIVAFEKGMLDDGLDPVTAMMVHAAADGLWLSSLFGFDHLTGTMRKRVVERLLSLTEGK
jgi:AcrR family transcriptional regulator